MNVCTYHHLFIIIIIYYYYYLFLYFFIYLYQIKCTQYWPNTSTTMYGDIAVTLESTHTFPDYTIRTLSVELVSRRGKLHHHSGTLI